MAAIVAVRPRPRQPDFPGDAPPIQGSTKVGFQTGVAGLLT